MATIIKRNGSTGVSYRIQVTVKNAGSGKRETKTTTWRPPNGMTERETQRELKKLEVQFEDECREFEKMQCPVSHDITVKEYSVEYLKHIEKESSVSHHAAAEQTMLLINEHLGCYKMKDISPVIVQRFLDMAKSRTYTTEYAVATNLEAVMKEQHLKAYGLSKLCKVTDSGIRMALSGGHLSAESAKKIAATLNCKVTKIFEIVTTKSGYAKSSIAKVHQILKAMLSHAKRQQVIPNNYATSDYVKGVPMERKRIQCLNKSQAMQLLDELKNETDMRVKTSIVLILLTGLRRGEAVGLEWSDIDFDAETLSVNRSISAVARRGIIEGKPKSEASERTFVMPPSLVELLKEYKVWWDDYVESLGDRYDGSGKLFLRPSGKHINPSTVLYWLHKALERCDLPKATVHSLRHTNISMLLFSRMIPDKAVSARAGHGSVKVTKDVYWELFQEDDKETAASIDSIFGL